MKVKFKLHILAFTKNTKKPSVVSQLLNQKKTNIKLSKQKQKTLKIVNTNYK